MDSILKNVVRSSLWRNGYDVVRRLGERSPLPPEFQREIIDVKRRIATAPPGLSNVVPHQSALTDQAGVISFFL
jgi:hypothetical protein